MGGWCLVGDYGKVPHLFIHLHLLLGGLHSALPIFSVWESVYGMYVSVFALFMCLCVESWSRCLSENAVTTAPNPPLRWYLLPPTPHICSCMFAIAAPCSQPPHFFLFYPRERTQKKGEKVAQFPPLGSHTPTEAHPRSNALSPHALSPHAQCLAPLSDLHMSPSRSLMHSHTVELFKSLRWGAPNSTVIVLEGFWFLDLSPAACLFKDQNTSTWTLLDTTQTPWTPLPLSMLPTYPLPFPLATSSGNSLYPSLSENVYTLMWIHLKINFCPSFEPSVHAKVGLFAPKLWAFCKYKQIIKSVHYTCVDNHWKLLCVQACTAAGFCHYHGIIQKSEDHIRSRK